MCQVMNGLTQVPPSLPCSIMAALAPSWLALLAQPRPPEPPPITNKSNALEAAITPLIVLAVSLQCSESLSQRSLQSSLFQIRSRSRDRKGVLNFATPSIIMLDDLYLIHYTCRDLGIKNKQIDRKNK